MRLWVRQADIDDGHAPGVSTAESARMRELEQENRELRRANEILKRAEPSRPSFRDALRAPGMEPRDERGARRRGGARRTLVVDADEGELR